MAARSPSMPVLMDVLDRAEQHQRVLDQSPEGLLAAVKRLDTGLSEAALIQGIQDHLNPDQAPTLVKVTAHDFGWARPRTQEEQAFREQERRRSPWKRLAYWLTSDQNGDENAAGQVCAFFAGAVIAVGGAFGLAHLLPFPVLLSTLGWAALLGYGEWRLYERVCHGLHNRCWDVKEATDIRPKEIKSLARHASVRRYVRACLDSEVPFIMNQDYEQILGLVADAEETRRTQARRQQWVVSFAHDPSPCEQAALAPPTD